MNVIALLANPRELAQRVLRAGLDRQPTWHTPHQWADGDGLYATQDQAWLYRRLPQNVLRSPEELGKVLLALAQECPGRQVHLLMHVWEHLPPSAPGTPAPLAAFQRDALSFLTPVRAGTIGVELAPASTAATGRWGKARQALADAADDLLGERAPDFGAYDADRERVSTLLAGHGASALSRDAAGYLESWYTLGASADVAASEGDDAIRIGGGGAVLEMATAGPLQGALERSELPDAERGASVLSVRGVLTVATGAKGAPEGVLMRTSVIFGRRCERPTSPFTVTLRQLRSVTPQPLPLRQLNALHETLPCSPRRLAPNHQRVGAAELAAVGFGDPGAPGADSGLLLGRGGTTMTRPVFVNPLAGNRRLVLVGQAGAGKTFASELLAFQAHLGGFGLTYLSAGTDAGTALTALAGLPAWQPSNAGDLDPFRWLSPANALAYATHLLTAVSGDLTHAEREAVQLGLARASRVGARDLFSALALADSPTSAAKLRRALTRDAAARLLTTPTEATAPGTLPRACRVDLSQLAGQPALHALAAAALVSARAETATSPHLMVVDDAAAILAQPVWQDALAAAQANAHLALLVVARQLDEVPPSVRSGSHVLAFAQDDPQALAWVGLEDTPAYRQWLRDAGPVTSARGVELSAACMYRAPHAAATGVSVGPWPEAALRALSRGHLTGYATT